MPFFYYMSNDALLLAMLAVFALGLFAQSRVRSVFNKYEKEQASKYMPAEEVARNLLHDGGSTVQVTQVSGRLTDHFNPKTNIVGLSDAVYRSSSISAIAVAAHEIGHVMQYENGYFPIRVRNAILPVASIGSQIAPWIVIFGMMFANQQLALFGVILFGAVFVFQLLTLPVELNASSRALAMLEGGNYLTADELPQAKKVLRAAAFTYIVAALASLVTLLQLLSISRRSRR